MKLKRLFLLCAVMILFIFTSARAEEPGSAADPLVSKSYVDAAIANALNSAAPAQLDLDRPQEQAPVSGGAFKPVSLSAGQILIGEEGTELILRSGKAAAYHQGTDGIVNITSGTEVFLGGAIERNNLIIIPRADGRGVQVFEDSWLIVKGGYHILNG